MATPVCLKACILLNKRGLSKALIAAPFGAEKIGYTIPMFGIRVLIYLLGIALIVWILIRLWKGAGVEKKSTKRVGDMARCAHCGIYIPRHEAILDSGRYYCCTQHRDEDRKP